MIKRSPAILDLEAGVTVSIGIHIMQWGTGILDRSTLTPEA